MPWEVSTTEEKNNKNTRGPKKNQDTKQKKRKNESLDWKRINIPISLDDEMEGLIELEELDDYTVDEKTRQLKRISKDDLGSKKKKKQKTDLKENQNFEKENKNKKKQKEKKEKKPKEEKKEEEKGTENEEEKEKEAEDDKNGEEDKEEKEGEEEEEDKEEDKEEEDKEEEDKEGDKKQEVIDNSEDVAYGYELSAEELSYQQKREKMASELEPIEMSEWSRFNLHPDVLRGLQSLRFEKPTAVQQSTLPVALLQKRDIIGSAETGSGKTLAYGIPILNHIAKRDQFMPPGSAAKKKLNRLSALILTPTRELAFQVAQHLKDASKFIFPLIQTIVGGLSQQKQKRLLGYKPDIIVATPGRLWEVMENQENYYLRDFSQLKFFVIDEADRMIEEGHFAELQNIIDAISNRSVKKITNEKDFSETVMNKREDQQDQEYNESPEQEEEGGEEEEEEEEEEEKEEKEEEEEEEDFNQHVQKRKQKKNTKRLAGQKGESVEKKKEKKSRIQIFVYSATLTLGENFKRKVKGKGSKKGAKNTIEDLMKKIDFVPPGPEIIDVQSARVVVDKLTETRIFCNADEKDIYLYYLLSRFTGKVVVFVNSIDCLKRLTSLLQTLKMENVYHLHAQMQQRQRLKHIDRFREKINSILIATDVVSRGIDIPDIENIIHYQIPRSPDVYVHRSGRTARAEKEGLSIMLVSPEDLNSYNKICKILGKAQGMKEFPAEILYIQSLKHRVNLAIKIEKEEHTEKKAISGQNWMKKAAKDLGVEYNEEDVHRDSRSSQRLRQMKEELDGLLQQIVVPKGQSTKYLTGSAIRDLPEILLKTKQMGKSLLQSKTSSALAFAKNKKKS